MGGESVERTCYSLMESTVSNVPQNKPKGNRVGAPPLRRHHPDCARVEKGFHLSMQGLLALFRENMLKRLTKP